MKSYINARTTGSLILNLLTTAVMCWVPVLYLGVEKRKLEVLDGGHRAVQLLRQQAQEGGAVPLLPRLLSAFLLS
jgi:hypothetical protein